MGFLSLCCAKTHLPVLHDQGWGQLAPRLTNIVVLLPNSSRIHAKYDGYGQGLQDNFASAKLVLANEYANETYAQLGPSGFEPGQGHFHNEKFILACAASRGFPSHADYRRALKEFHADESRRTALAFAELELVVPEDAVYEVFRALEAAAEPDEYWAQHTLERQPKAKRFVKESWPERQAQARLFFKVLDLADEIKAREVLKQYALPTH